MSEAQAESSQTLIGHCLCKAVALSVRHDNPQLGVCHCGICRAWGGGPFMSLESHQAPIIEGIENVTIYATSEWAERGFCMHCGTHLFYRLKEGDFYAVSAGLFSHSGEWPISLQVFIDEKPENYALVNETHTMTGQEVFDAWSSQNGEDHG